ncbi:MAG: hypothetical protein ACRCVK_11320 [Aeromonas veronii]
MRFEIRAREDGIADGVAATRGDAKTALERLRLIQEELEGHE